MKFADSIQTKIMNIIAVSGEVNIDDLLILGYNKKYTIDTVYKLEKEGLIKPDKENCKIVRLTRKGKNKLINKNPKRYSPLFTGRVRTNNIRSEYWSHERNVKLGGITSLCSRLHIKFFDDEKSALKMSTDYSDFLGSVVEKENADLSNAEFYNFSEIGNYLSEEYKKSRNTRLMGLLITDDKVVIAYHTGSESMIWNSTIEENMCRNIESEICKEKFGLRKSPIVVMFASKSHTASLLVKCEGGVDNKLFTIKSTAFGTHFISLDEHAEIMLKILCDSATYDGLYEYCSRNIDNLSRDARGSDGTDSEGRTTLFAFDGNLERIWALYVAMKEQKEKNKKDFKKCHIICIDFQKEYIESIFEDMAYIETINEDLLKGWI